ncbi:MAG: VOC family protein [Oligoflexales bacterium]
MTPNTLQENMSNCRPFHLALPVNDLEETKDFYMKTIGCSLGRTSDSWIDLNFFGHQLTFHQSALYESSKISNKVDSKSVPIPHLGVILTMEQWKDLAKQLQEKEIEFIIEPYIRFAGQSGEQATMFIPDPSGYHLEFKAFADDQSIF